VFREIIKSWNSLPKSISIVCNTQFFSWMAWFPFLFYSSSWVSGLKTSDEETGDENFDVRRGSFALLLFAIVSVIAGFIGPAFQSRLGIGLPRIWATSLWLFFSIILMSRIVPELISRTFAVSLIGICWGIFNLS
jgi:solute carrier family 45 protein 1/2/4